MTDQEEAAALFREYEALAHAMQSAVGFKMHRDEKETTPKHLRVGVNAAMVDSAALAKLLMEKGIITELEYARALRDGMKAEVERYQTWFAERGLPGITFG